MRTVSPITVESYLAELPPARQKLIAALRRVIKREAPAATEHVYLGWRAIGFRHPAQGYFCGVFPFEERVLLVFEWGVLLADPEHRLTGNGRQVRTLAFDPGDAVPTKALQAFLRSALDLPPSRAAKLDLLRGRAIRLG